MNFFKGKKVSNNLFAFNVKVTSKGDNSTLGSFCLPVEEEKNLSENNFPGIQFFLSTSQATNLKEADLLPSFKTTERNYSPLWSKFFPCYPLEGKNLIPGEAKFWSKFFLFRKNKFSQQNFSNGSNIVPGICFQREVTSLYPE